MDLAEAEQAARQADQDAADAQALVTELETRLASGDESVTADQLDEQHRLTRWAKLRAQGAAEKRKAAAVQAATASAIEVVDRVAQIDTTDADLVAVWTDAVQAVRRLARAALERSQIVQTNTWDLQDADRRLQHVGADPIGSLGVLPAMYAGDTGYQIPDREVNATDVPATTMVATAVEVAVRGTLKISEVSVDRFRTLTGSTLTGRVSGWDAVARNVEARSDGH